MRTRLGREAACTSRRGRLGPIALAMCALAVAIPLIVSDSSQGQSQTVTTTTTAPTHQVASPDSATHAATSGKREDDEAARPVHRTLQLAASYDAAGAHFSSTGASFTVGLATERRGGVGSHTVDQRLRHTANLATYGTHALTESFQTVPAGIEQTFSLATRPGGNGPLTISVPLAGARAKGAGQTVGIQNPGSAASVATYSDLRVTDAEHHLVPASMAASSDGSAVDINVRDANAVYPLEVDPVWSNATGTLWAVGQDGMEALDLATGDEDASVGGGGDLIDSVMTPNGQMIYGVDYTGGELYPFNLSTDTEESPIGVSYYPVAVVVSPDGTEVYTVTEDGIGSYLCPITVATNTRGTCVELPVLGGPAAITPNGKTLWIDSGDDDQLIPYNLPSLTEGTPISLPSHNPGALYINASGTTAYALDGTVIVPINLETDAASPAISWPSGAAAMAFVPNGTTAWVANDGNKSITALNLMTDTAGASISLASLPSNEGYELKSIALSPDAQTAYVIDFYDNVIPISLSTGALGTPIFVTVSGAPTDLIMTPGGLYPQGTAVTAAEIYAGGSPSERCQSCSSPVPATRKTGDPVDTATGDFSESNTNLSIPGAGVPLNFTSTYDAQAAQAEVDVPVPAGPLGYGWTDNLNMSVAYNSSTQIATVTEENGAQTTFTPYSSGTSPAWCSGSTNFCATAPRIDATLNENTGGSWTFTRTLGLPETFSFNSSGVLSQITDSGGDSLTSSSYSAGSGQTPCPSGGTCTAWTSSASGREMVLALNSSGRLVKVFDANSSLGATFAFSGSGCSSWSGS